MKLKHLLALALVAMGSSAWAQQAWTDVTSKITNPSFESDNAIADLTTCDWATDRATGWTILPESASNAQVGIGNSSSKLQGGVGASSSAAAGDKFFYTRNNWNADTNFSVEQTISSGLPAGLYMLTLKIKAASSSPDKTKYTISLQEGGKDAVTNTNAGSAAEWLNCGVLINKTDDNTSLTIKANMLPGAANGSQHYVMMIDDVQLKYLSTSDIDNLTPENTLDVSGVIYNAGIYNANKANMPRGWVAYKSTRGNSNYTEGTGDTRLEGWSGGNLDIDYYQQIAGLPAGKYRLTATCGDSNDRGAYAYIYNAGTSEKVTVDMGSAAADITTPSISVAEGNAINIGIAGDNLKNGSWVTGDNFRLEYLGTGIDLTAWNSAKADAETALGEYDEKYAATERAAVVEAKNAANPTTDDGAVSMPADLNTKIATYRTKAANEKLMEEKQSLTDAIARIKTEYPNSSDEVLNTDLSKWKISTYTVMNNREHWSGAASYKYYEQSSAQWGQNSWSIYAEETVNLPVGKYAFVVTARAAAETTTKMTINGTEYELCHKGASGYGIATNGEATFDMAKTYANGNNGYGWEYAYAEFEITEAKDVTFRFDASTSTVRNWVSIANPVLYYNDAAKDAMELVRKNAVIEQIAGVLGEEDANVPKEKMNADVASALADAVTTAKDGSTSNTVDELNGFKSALETAIANANASVTNYSKVVAINTKAAALDAAGQAAYAETLAAYNNGTLTKDDEEAQAQAAYIAAVKAQTTSNTNMTEVLANPSFENGTTGWTTNNVESINNDGFTMKVGNNYLQKWASASWVPNISAKQTIENLPAGVYRLSVNGFARGNQDNPHIYAKVGESTFKTSVVEEAKTYEVEFVLSEKSNVEIGCFTQFWKEGDGDRWFAVDDFRLERVSNVPDPITRSTATGKYGTICAPFAAEATGATVYSAAINEYKTAVTLTEVGTELEAGVPYIYTATDDAQTFTCTGASVAKPIDSESSPLRGVFTAISAPVDSYVMQTQEGVQKFYKVVENAQPTLSAYKAYLTVPTTNAKSLKIGLAEETAIKAIDALMSGDAKIYDMNGREQKSLQKGVNIVNGVKVLVK